MTDRVGGSDDRGDPALNESSRSEEACPRCGAHRLALLTLPEIDTTGYRPLDEAYGLVAGPALQEPAIGCLACGAEWRHLADLRADGEAGSKSATDA